MDIGNVVAQYHSACDAFALGDPAPVKALYARHEDVKTSAMGLRPASTPPKEHGSGPDGILAHNLVKISALAAWAGPQGQTTAGTASPDRHPAPPRVDAFRSK